MGYDEDECVVCYLEGNGNNHCQNKQIVCASCLDRLCQHTSQGTKRVRSVLTRQLVINDEEEIEEIEEIENFCYLCNCKCVIRFYTSVCEKDHNHDLPRSIWGTITPDNDLDQVPCCPNWVCDCDK